MECSKDQRYRVSFAAGRLGAQDDEERLGYELAALRSLDHGHVAALYDVVEIAEPPTGLSVPAACLSAVVVL